MYLINTAVCSLPVPGVQHSVLSGQMPMPLKVFVPEKVATSNGRLVFTSANENCQQTCTY